MGNSVWFVRHNNVTMSASNHAAERLAPTGIAFAYQPRHARCREARGSGMSKANSS